jgi:hypothetical protein
LENETEFECPNCGEMVYQELFACPKCGLVFHPLDEDDDEQPEASGGFGAAQPVGFSLGAVAAGWVVSAGVAFFISYIVSSLLPGVSAAGRVFLFLAGPLGALLGGMVAAHLAGQRLVLHGLGVGLLSMGSAYLLEAVRRDLAADPLITETIVSWAVILAAGPLGARLLGLKLPALAGSGTSEKRLYNTLLARVRYDKETAERLIDFERRRLPNASRAVWVERAVERLEHDRR